MKIRIKGNSIRLRLSKSEVEKLADTLYIEERTPFGENIFTYTLLGRDDISQLSARFENGEIKVFIPSEFIRGWSESDITGFNGIMKKNNGESLYILVEKDFKCIDKTAEDQSDNYENPNMIC